MKGDLLHDGERWKSVARQIALDEKARQALLDRAAEWLKVSRLSVVDKKHPAPGGDFHDYVSQGPYWWPDPASSDGLPYVRRDGEVNPESKELDNDRLNQLHQAVSVLTLAGQVTGDGSYRRHAGRLLRGWFIAAETRMNPHLDYGQRVPGICEGRGIGIIDTVQLCYTLDVVAQLPFSEDWTEDDLRETQGWFSQYLDWLLQSDHGRTEEREHNNHGTWYDVQVACFAIFSSRHDVARHQLATRMPERLAAQIAEDGSQPHELTRTLSLTYCTFNLMAMVTAARLGQHVSLDLWNWRGREGQSLRLAMDWLLPYLTNQLMWRWPQIVPFQGVNGAMLAALAGQSADKSRWGQTAIKLARHPSELLFMNRPTAKNIL